MKSTGTFNISVSWKDQTSTEKTSGKKRRKEREDRTLFVLRSFLSFSMTISNEFGTPFSHYLSPAHTQKPGF